MNLLTKTAPWVMASLLATASVFGQSNSNSKCPPPQKTFSQGDELMANQYMAAYNAPARIDVRGAWDFYGTGSFTYWQAAQDNMEIAMLSDDTTATGVHNRDYLNMNFDFQPGFKVGGGMNFDHDNWDTRGEYTWFRGTSSHSGANLDTTVDEVVYHAMWGDTSAKTAHSASEKWRLHMDLADVELGRSYYSGMSLTFRPFVGVRGAWIRQKAEIAYVEPALDSSFDILLITQSWGVGPRAGISSNWLLGQGFRLFGDGSADILYTRYTKLSQKESNRVAGTTPTIWHQKNLGTVRPHVDLNMGIGWAMYFDNNNWHVDLSAGYEFQVFFAQNMFRQTVDSTNKGFSTITRGDLYVQGLTATARFDF